MAEKEFNPSSPEYKKVEDLPKEEQENFVNVEGGFVGKEAEKMTAEQTKEYYEQFEKDKKEVEDLFKQIALENKSRKIPEGGQAYGGFGGDTLILNKETIVNFIKNYYREKFEEEKSSKEEEEMKKDFSSITKIGYRHGYFKLYNIIDNSILEIAYDGANKPGYMNTISQENMRLRFKNGADTGTLFRTIDLSSPLIQTSDHKKNMEEYSKYEYLFYVMDEIKKVVDEDIEKRQRKNREKD